MIGALVSLALVAALAAGYRAGVLSERRAAKRNLETALAAAGYWHAEAEHWRKESERASPTDDPADWWKR